MSPEDRVVRARHAERLLEDELFIEAMRRLEKEYTRIALHDSDLDTRELHRNKLLALLDIPRDFLRIVDDGKHAANAISEKEQKRNSG